VGRFLFLDHPGCAVVFYFPAKVGAFDNGPDGFAGTSRVLGSGVKQSTGTANLRN